MMNSNQIMIFLSVVLATFGLVASDVEALSTACPEGEFGYSLSGKTVPSTTRGAILTGYEGQSFEVDSLAVVEVETDREISIDIAEREDYHRRYEISFLDDLKPEKTYRLDGWDDEMCGPGGGSERVEDEALLFRTVEAREVPVGLGRLEVSDSVSGELMVSFGDGLPRDHEAEWMDISVQMPEETKPWKEALFFETYVDGERWGSRGFSKTVRPGESRYGMGRDRVYLICEPGIHSSPGVGEGSFELKTIAFLPGTDLRFETPAETLELECSGFGGCQQVSGGNSPVGTLLAMGALILWSFVGRRRREFVNVSG